MIRYVLNDIYENMFKGEHFDNHVFPNFTRGFSEKSNEYAVIAIKTNEDVAYVYYDKETQSIVYNHIPFIEFIEIYNTLIEGKYDGITINNKEYDLTYYVSSRFYSIILDGKSIMKISEDNIHLLGELFNES